MLNKDALLKKLKILRQKYEKDGVIICGVFGSYAREEETQSSDVDIAYKINKAVFSQSYKGFKAASKIAEIAHEISKELGEKVDFISLESSNRTLNKNINNELLSCK